MILFPAIDIRDGHAVRLTQGDYDREQIYNDDPLAAAMDWVEGGATHLHVVDLDGARDGERRNLGHLARIASAAGVPVQYGGGLRDMESIAAAIDAGAWRAVIGTAAFRERARVEAAVAEYGDRVVVSADARDGMIAAQGWTEATEIAATDAVKELNAVGVATFVYTDIARDGMLQGLNLDTTIALADAISIPVIASGGLASIADIKALLEPRAKKLAGAIAGRALYDGRLDAADALALIRAARTSG